MKEKTILLVDDEQIFLEPLADALENEFRIIKATNVFDALKILDKHKIDLITIDLMIDPGGDGNFDIDSHYAGLYLCKKVKDSYYNTDAICISVISESTIIRRIESMGIKYIKKGETPLRTVLKIIKSKLSDITYYKEF